MKSSITLQHSSGAALAVTNRSLQHLCFGHIPYALASLIALPEGHLLEQSYSSYLAHIALYEYTLHQEAVISYVLTEPSVILFVILQGAPVQCHGLTRPVSNASAGTFYLAYLNQGDYTVKVGAGLTRFVQLTIRPEWMNHKSLRLEHLKSVATYYQQASQPFFSLPDCRLSNVLIRQVNRLILHEGADRDDLDILINTALTQLLRKYDDLLASDKYSSITWNAMKAREIADYVHSCYTEKLDDNEVLAARFNVSERQFLRLVKIAFDMPLQAYLLKIRMSKAIVKLISTRRPIYEVAAEVGYHNPHYFSFAFKRYHNISPSEVHGLCL